MEKKRNIEEELEMRGCISISFLMRKMKINEMTAGKILKDLGKNYLSELDNLGYVIRVFAVPVETAQR